MKKYSLEDGYKRHAEFQFGTNPMKMSEFEKGQINKERQARNDVRYEQSRGIQGRDGGYFASDDGVKVE